MPLDEDEEHARYDARQVAAYFAAATQAALVLAEFRAPFRGRSTPVNAWWGSFDLAVSLFSGAARGPAVGQDFIMRNAMDAQEVAVGWWPGDPPLRQGGLLRLRAPGRRYFSQATLSPGAARWDGDLGEFVLDWDDVRTAETRTRRRWSSRARRSGTPARCATGTRPWPPARTALPRRSASRGPRHHALRRFEHR